MAQQWLTARTARWRLKPFVFVVALIPLAIAIAKTLGFIGGLGSNPVETLLDHFGNWGLRFLILALAISPLRQLTGQNWIGLFRRMIGLFAFTYVLGHFLVYLILDQGLANLGYVLEDIIERPYITLGIAALLILTALALTSTAAARRALGARWQQLHYGAYAAGILGVWHYYWQVKKDITEPLIYAAILAGLLGYRLWNRRIRELTPA